jgi:hypothetical protein
MEGVEVWLRTFLTAATDGDEWSTSRPNSINLGKEPPAPTE